MQIDKPYTGANGFYASLRPTEESKAKMVEWFKRLYPEQNAPLNYQEDIGLHCTVIYSLAFLKITPAAAKTLVDNALQNQYPVEISHFDYWPGHDEKGYFVAKLKSEALHKRHRLWKDMGAIPTYPTYEPHITLATGTPAQYWSTQLTALNKAVKLSPLALVLDSESITDLST